MDSQELIAFAIANPDQISGSLEYQLSSIYWSVVRGIVYKVVRKYSVCF